MHCVYFCGIATLFFLLIPVKGIQDWTFSLNKFDTNSSDPNLVLFKLKMSRKEPGVYALNGTVVLGMDVDDKIDVEVKLYRSPTRSGQYSVTPYQITKKPFCNFIETFYIPMLQADLKSCSTLPVYDVNSCEPLVKGTYNFNMCLITNGGMPSHLDPGFYKVVANLKSEEVDVWVGISAEAQRKTLP